MDIPEDTIWNLNYKGLPDAHIWKGNIEYYASLLEAPPHVVFPLPHDPTKCNDCVTLYLDYIKYRELQCG